MQGFLSLYVYRDRAKSVKKSKAVTWLSHCASNPDRKAKSFPLWSPHLSHRGRFRVDPDLSGMGWVEEEEEVQHGCTHTHALTKSPPILHVHVTFISTRPTSRFQTAAWISSWFHPGERTGIQLNWNEELKWLLFCTFTCLVAEIKRRIKTVALPKLLYKCHLEKHYHSAKVIERKTPNKSKYTILFPYWETWFSIKLWQMYKIFYLQRKLFWRNFDLY